ncbi:MAG: T9SS type A sorting domain-containing protein, partial [Bacteroidota bacterium]|nr:T9SS type A sorting domain-containing protein [Bacteroidota bacterium]
AGTYRLTTDSLENLPTGYQAYLHDATAGTFTDLAATPTFSLALPTGTVVGSRYAVLFTTQPRVLGTAPQVLAKLVSLYPNPAHGTTTMLLPAALRQGQSIAVEVCDALGRVLLTRTLPTQAVPGVELPVASLAPGVYVVRAHTPVGIVSRRLVIQ